jgi:hypothetical protein
VTGVPQSSGFGSWFSGLTPNPGAPLKEAPYG